MDAAQWRFDMKLRYLVYSLVTILLMPGCKADKSPSQTAPTSQAKESSNNSDFKLLFDFTNMKCEKQAYTPTVKERNEITNQIKSKSKLRNKITFAYGAMGSFTASGVKEIIYIVLQEDPKACHAEGWGKYYFAITSDHKCQVIPVEGPMDILTTIRTTKGVDLLFVLYPFDNQGVTENCASIQSLENGVPTVVKDFDIVESSNCAFDNIKGKTTVSKIYIRQIGNKFEYKREHFIAQCGTSNTWKSLGINDKNDGEQ